MHREDFPILDKDFIYFDNGATTMKPKCVVDSVVSYYTDYTANAHRGDYDNSLKVDLKYEEVRTKVKNLINCDSEKEVVFTSGTTDSLNRIVFGYMKYNLHAGDEVLITKAEHASNFLPWIELAKEIGVVIKYIPLYNHLVTIENVEKSITDKTKVISLAHVTNVLGDVRPVKEIGELCKKNNIIFVVDGAQSVPHMKVDVLDMNIDFLAFSAHKMCGPTGVGVLYGRFDLLDKLKPTTVGGGMNSSFTSDGEVEYKMLPNRLEAGTPNIAGVIGMGSAIDYLMSIGIDKISEHERNLKKYFLEKVKDVEGIVIYNGDIDGGTVAFNIDGVFSQDTAVYLNHYNNCVRAGNHCAKVLKEDLLVKNTCRISFYLYNTEKEIDKLIEVLKESKEIFKIIL